MCVVGWAWAWDATDSKMESPVGCWFGLGPAAIGGVGMPGEGRRYIASMVGRRAAPNGVERKSVGRSVESLAEAQDSGRGGEEYVPLI